jgi:heat shock protein HslJ
VRRVAWVLLLLFVLASPAAAQGRPNFPLDKPFTAISISGFDVQKMKLTLSVSKDAKGDGLRGSGHAGCNSWSATVILRDEQIDFTDPVTTKKACSKPVMKAEEAFLTSLKSARRWRLDGERLVIEGDAARLLMKAGMPPAGR